MESQQNLFPKMQFKRNKNVLAKTLVANNMRCCCLYGVSEKTLNFFFFSFQYFKSKTFKDMTNEGEKNPMVIFEHSAFQRTKGFSKY